MKIEILRKLVAWERSYMQDRDNESIVRLFQELIDSGDIQQMEYYYKQTARMLIDHGLCHDPVLRIVK